MPWWGWLIGFGIVTCCATVVIVMVVMTQTMKAMSRDADAEASRRQRGLASARPMWISKTTTRREG